MRLKRTNFVLGIFVITWALVLYFAFLSHLTTKSEPNGNVDSQIMILEQGISEQFKINNDMIHDARRFLELKSQGDVGKSSIKDFQDFKLPVLVFACNRVSVSRCLDRLLQYRPDPDKFPIIVSQDCNHEETTETIRRYGSQVSLIQQPDQSDIQVPPKEKKFKGYFKIARHYGWALNQMFFNFNFSTVIIVEDDLEVAPDFFEYFLGTYSILTRDPTLWCVSAWNDNGKEGLVDENRPDLLYRTDFFPGLGWMLTKSLWLELYTKWPRAYWDDWIRDPSQRKGRACVRPEISRTRTFGKFGVSNGMFFEKHLKYIKLNEKFVPFTKMNLSYLVKQAYDRDFIRDVYQSVIVSYQELKEGKVAHDGPVRIVYRSKEEYKIFTKKLGLMDDFKSGVPRTAYKGIVTFHYKGRMVHLAPNVNWKGYDLTWS
ncbi:alpha-1,3-mannosyl-glycoprotein 2-beta-N-acetylglucosaminyltransferase [Tribolium castaneum]|nr:PREDICTED: alpha-1,3-mannosyl-glycoprotein 2-beta-N-acetylglucosaminyltransferase [Tribolium castaneum]XP_973340.3 PREDICTED: alpha-1,3-mannosyl-glycoprotein 2-beta-N-acetylglucosaminyltransferase [Tribolium castaneum]|eukprot:XP_008195651.1 PREDICTED: alpha-1,3-mannosyl-glycoprotein 2-beta-N-acetylglucosaminyltransferase [Tribolium castaneum]